MTAVPIIYVAGAGRSGTTILDNALGQVNGIFSAGEIAHIWQRGFLQNRLCGCGVPFRTCPQWQAIIGSAFGEVSEEKAERLAQSMPRTRDMFRMHAVARSSRRSSGEYEILLEAVELLYHAISESTGSRAVVDSSKGPAYAYLLSTIPSLELHIVHMIRDPRAVAFSWSRKKPSPGKGPGQYMTTHGSFNSALFWNTWNLQTETLRSRPIASYTQLRYEDFVTAPSNGLRSILEATGIPNTEPPPITDGSLVLTPTHTVSGNPSRFQTGLVKFRLDSAWKSNMRVLDRTVVEALTGPLMRRYGYPIRMPRQGDQ